MHQAVGTSAGVGVPSDVAVVGWDDVRTARYVRPGLTTVRQPVQDLGALAADRLHDLVSGSQPINVDASFEIVGRMPGILIVFVLCFVGVTLLLNFSAFGRRAVAIGGQERVARLSGVPIRRMKVLLFAFSGLMAGLGGVVLTARVGAATPTAAVGFELTAIAAVVLGGTPLTGGVGSMTNTVVGTPGSTAPARAKATAHQPSAP